VQSIEAVTFKDWRSEISKAQKVVIVKKALSYIITAILTFFIGFYSITYWAFYYSSETSFELSSIDKKTDIKFLPPDKNFNDVRPLLRSDYAKLKDSQRDGLRGQVKLVHEQFATFVYKESGFEREKEGNTNIGRKMFYDAKGKKTSDRTLRRCGLPASEKYIYDDRGFLIELIKFKKFDKTTITSRTVYLYDDESKLTESHSYDGEGKLTSKCTYQYQFDNHGNWIVQIPVSAEQPLSTGERTYGKYRKIIYYR
jgi:hypothetical protein